MLVPPPGGIGLPVEDVGFQTMPEETKQLPEVDKLVIATELEFVTVTAMMPYT